MNRRALRALAAPLALASACRDEQVIGYDPAPFARILEPTGEEIIDAPGIHFVGVVEDNDPPSELLVSWTSTLVEGPLAEVAPDTSGYMEFTLETLPIGTQTISLSVTDPEGQTDTASITLLVSAAIDPPMVTINQPQEGFLYYDGTPLLFQGVVTDSDGNPGVFQIEWASDQQGPIYTGVTTADGLSEFETTLSSGTHLIQFRTYDELGTLAIDDVQIEIGILPVGQLDQDGDGFCPDGIDADGNGRCEDAEVTGPDSQDCNDFAVTVCPGCPEICDGFDDNNCDGIPDPQDQDLDGDGWTLCEGDCDDSEPWNFPTNPELCDGLDNDCDGAPDFDALGEVDHDGDTVRSCLDCNDAQPLSFPGNAEVCDGIDNDCNGVVDDAFDLDGDGYAVCDGDCNDLNSAINPGSPEVCDGFDNDCNGTADDGYDNDGDGWTTCEGDCNDSQSLSFPGNAEVCDGVDNDCNGFIDDNFDVDGDGWATCEGDCNDLQAAAYPGATEVCDGIDNDCNGTVDDGFDDDGDGWTTCAGDCDDDNDDVYPGHVEICDGLNNDCDASVDEGFDVDGDGWTTCEGDCNDLSVFVNPSATEACDTLDNDCDGYVNENNAGLYEMWETSANSPGYQLSSINPQVVFGGGTCSLGGVFRLQAGTASVNGVFSSPMDLWDIYEWDTDLTTNVAAWLAFLASGNGLPSSCTTGTVGWTASQPISVTAYVDGQPYSGSGSSGTLAFTLGIFQLFDIEYRVVVQPLATWTNCNYTYTLTFYIP
jgi:hypothetical protein